MNKQPEALRLAAVAICDRSIGWQADATAELRRLHAENEEFLEVLKIVSQTAVYVSNGECSVSIDVVRRIDAAVAKAEGEET